MTSNPYTSAEEEGMLLQKYHDRTGRCIAMLSPTPHLTLFPHTSTIKRGHTVSKMHSRSGDNNRGSKATLRVVILEACQSSRFWHTTDTTFKGTANVVEMISTPPQTTGGESPQISTSDRQITPSSGEYTDNGFLSSHTHDDKLLESLRVLEFQILGLLEFDCHCSYSFHVLSAMRHLQHTSPLPSFKESLCYRI